MTGPSLEAGGEGGIRFAVVIPLYNKRPHIARALASALGQSHAPVEVIVVDDASTDGGLDVVKGFDDPRIRVLRRTEPGPGGYAARNLAIEEARADWIAFLDADDEWTADHLAAIDRTIRSGPADGSARCVFSGFTIREANGERRQDPYTVRRGREAVRAFDFPALVDLWLELRSCPIWTSAAAFRRSALMEAGLFPAGRCRRGGDKDLWLRASRGGVALACPAVTAVYYRDAVNMVTSSERTNSRHCLCATVRALELEEGGNGRLRRLLNMEILQYAAEATKHGPVSAGLTEDYYASEGPLGAVLLRLLTTRAGAGAAQALRRLRHRLG